MLLGMSGRVSRGWKKTGNHCCRGAGVYPSWHWLGNLGRSPIHSQRQTILHTQACGPFGLNDRLYVQVFGLWENPGVHRRKCHPVFVIFLISFSFPGLKRNIINFHMWRMSPVCMYVCHTGYCCPLLVAHTPAAILSFHASVLCCSTFITSADSTAAPLHLITDAKGPLRC